MVQAIDKMYKCQSFSEAEEVFRKLVSWLRRSRLEPMKRIGNTLKKQKARGFRTFAGYRSMIYLVVGKLRLDCPEIFRNFSRYQEKNPFTSYFALLTYFSLIRKPTFY